MNIITLENGKKYLISMNCDYNKKKYIYMINEEDESDIEIAEITENNTLKFVYDPELLKNIIKEMVLYIYRFFE